jgi:hypothetical protein
VESVIAQSLKTVILKTNYASKGSVMITLLTYSMTLSLFSLHKFTDVTWYLTPIIRAMTLSTETDLTVERAAATV